MNISIDEAKLQEYVEASVQKKVDALTDQIIQDKVQETLFGRIDSVFGAYGGEIRACIDRHVREIINEKANLSPEQFDSAAKSIAGRIAYDVKDKIIESLAYALMPEEEEKDDEGDV